MNYAKNKITTFIVCHNQDIIESDIKSKKFDLMGKVFYIFVGNNNFSKIKHFDNVFIAKELMHNIEEYPNIFAYTAWYAIWKNNLCNSEYINLLEYDVDIYDSNLIENLNELIFLKNPNIVNYIVHPKHYYWLNSSYYSSSLIDALLSVYNIDILSKINYDGSWGATNNICFKYECFNHYMNWFEPMLEHINKNDKAGHNQERSHSVYSFLNNFDLVYLNGITHYAMNSHGKY